MSQLKKTLLELKCFMELSDLLMIFLPQMMGALLKAIQGNLLRGFGPKLEHSR